MTYSDYSLTEEEYKKYLKKQKCTKLNAIWGDLLERMDDPSLKQEAEEKGFSLVDNPDFENDSIAYYKMLTVPKGSKKLQDYMVEKLYPYVVCLKL